MALFESYERRIDKINGVLAQYGISSVEECREICQAKGFDPYEIVKGIQPICFENACWAYTVGAAIALKKGVKSAAEAAEAIGIGLTMRYGGSTGGTDIIALMVNKYWPVNLSRVFLYSDFVIVILVLFLPDKTFADMIYGFVEITSFILMIDMVVGGQKSYQLMVFSEKNSQIADYICKELDRGVTVIQGMGWYTKKNRDILLIMLDQKQFLPLSRTIKEMDPKAFISVAPTHSVYGEGFSEIKAGPKLNIRKNTSNELPQE